MITVRNKIMILTCILCIILPKTSSLMAKEIKPLVRIPFITNGFQTYIELQVNGSNEKLCFGFDTGAGGTVLDRNYLTSSNITLTGEKEDLATSVNVVQVDISKNNKINANGLDIGGIKFYIESLSHMNVAPNGKKIAGVIGFDLIKNHVTYINHEENYIELYPAGTKLYSNAKELPIFLHENEVPAFYATIQTESGKTLPVRLIFDSGASFTSSLSSSFISKYDLLSDLKVKVKIPVIGGAQSSTSVNYLSSHKQLQFGDFTFNHVPVNLSTSTTGAMATDSIDGVIGFDLIKRFNVVLDYDNKIIKLIPNKHFKTPFNINLTGLSFRKENDLITVSGVMDYSPAKKAGIKEGDVIISIDKKHFTSVTDVRNYLKNSYKAKKFVIKRAGELLQISVKPANFY